MWPGWIPILQPDGFMIPGQLGPIRRDFDWLLRAFITCVTMVQYIRPGVANAPYSDLVCLGNTLCNANNQAHLILDGLNDGICSGRWRDIEDCSIRLGFPDSLKQRGLVWTRICQVIVGILRERSQRPGDRDVSVLLCWEKRLLPFLCRMRGPLCSGMCPK